MADPEGIESRLDNIRAVEPILGAMRTVALGSWQAALSRQQHLQQYSQRLTAILASLTPRLGASRRRPGKRWFAGGARAQQTAAPIVVLVIGSERGLCGAFNSTLARYVDGLLDRYAAEGRAFELATLGSRVQRALSRIGQPPVWSRSLPMTTLPSSDLAHELAYAWLRRYEALELDGVELVYNAYRNPTLYETVRVRLIPPALPAVVTEGGPWPLPHIDTDPIALYTRLVMLWATTEMYRVLLDSAAAEHSARFRLMEGATQNSSRLIAELTLALQTARQHAITLEMQELASGAGLLAGQ